MKNGTIIQQRFTKGSDWKSNLVQQMIVNVCDSPYTHSRVYINGFIYEFTSGKGVRKKEYKASKMKDSYDFLETIKEMTVAEAFAMQMWWEDKLRDSSPYNYIKLFTCLLLAKTKPFWAKIGYVPFTHPMWGEFCSAGVDEGFKFINWDLRPDQIEAFTSCGDLTGSVLHKKREGIEYAND